MKIDLTKDEWEFLREVLDREFDLSDISCFEEKFRFKCEKSFENISNKLGKEWVDEEKEMRKFLMGFAYKPKVKNDHI